MPKKLYKISESESNDLMNLNEPSVAYQKKVVSTSLSGEWNPNIPFHGTQKEWWEHFHRIEEGNFETWDEHQKKFYAWKKKYLTNLM